MNTREHAHHVLDQLPDGVVGELLDFAEFLKTKYPSPKRSASEQSFEAFRGGLAKSPHFNGDLVKLQRALRNEWA